MYCISCIQKNNYNIPFENCVLLPSLSYLLNQQIEVCVNEFMRLNQIGLQSNSFTEISKCSQKMRTIIDYMIPLKGYTTQYSRNTEFFEEIFKVPERKVYTKEMFQKFNNLFYKKIN